MKQPNSMRRPLNAGFTLIELVVTMVVVAILAAIAIPSYQNQVRHSRRTDAKSALLDLAAREQNVYATTTAYGTTPASVGYTGASFPVTVGSGYYSVNLTLTAAVAPTSTAVTGTPAGFTLVATPIAGTTQANDLACQSFTLTSAGVQSALNSASVDNTAICWGS
jgi:type IV pilus assembly protein PilE